jgi:hypothetical protein
MTNRVYLNDWNNLTPGDVQYCIGIVEKMGTDFDRNAYEEARFVDAALPPWELFEPALKRHPWWPQLAGRFTDGGPYAPIDPDVTSES